MTRLEMYERARRRLTDPRAWVKRKSHRQADGDLPAAYCLGGALIVECGGVEDARDVRDTRLYHEIERELVHIAHREWPMLPLGVSIPNFNDARETTHEMVLHVLDIAIERHRVPADVEPSVQDTRELVPA